VSKRQEIICGLDIGTTKICMLIARSFPGPGLEVVSTGYALSGGLKKGVVIDLEEAAASIRKAADEAELKSGISVDWVVVGVSGDHVQSFNCHGAISIDGKNNEVSLRHIQQVIHAAQSIPMPAGRDLVHILPQEYILDNRGDIINPVGLTGSRLDVNIHVVTCQESLKQNLVAAVNRAQMRVERVVLQQLASAEAVLTADEKELGAAIIDIGGGTTDIAAFLKQSVRHTSVLPVGGDHFTRDLAVGLCVPIDVAERIKKEFGTVLVDGIAEDETLETQGFGTNGPQRISRKVACQILRDRAVEILELVKAEIARSGIREYLTTGIVLTGGGSMLDGMLPLAGEMLELSARQGIPRGVLGLTDDLFHPVYATAIGLAMYGAGKNGDHAPASGRSSSASWFPHKFLSWVSN